MSYKVDCYNCGGEGVIDGECTCWDDCCCCAEAPKDGTEIVLWGACSPRSSTSRYARDANVGWFSGGQWYTRVGGEHCAATHWMPLPPAPEGGVEIISHRGHKIGDVQVNFTVGRITPRGRG